MEDLKCPIFDGTEMEKMEDLKCPIFDGTEMEKMEDLKCPICDGTEMETIEVSKPSTSSVFGSPSGQCFIGRRPSYQRGGSSKKTFRYICKKCRIEIFPKKE